MADRIVQLSDDEGGKAPSQSTKCGRCGYHLHAYDFDMDRLGRVRECCPVCTGRVKLAPKPALPVHRCAYCSIALDSTYAPSEAVCRRCLPRTRIWNKCEDCGANCRQTRCSECRRKWQLRKTRAQEQARRDRLKGYWASKELHDN